MPKEFLSPQEVAEILDVSEDTAQALFRAMPHVRVGKPGSKKPRLRMRAEVFYGWLAQQDGYMQTRNPLRAIRGGKA